MTRSPILAAIMVLLVSAGPCLSEGTQRHRKWISEDAVRTASAELYSDILARACRNGWRYPRSQIKKGFKRHLEELKLQLVVQGYAIVPDATVNNSRRSRIQTAFRAMRQAVASRPFGCARPYWLDD